MARWRSFTKEATRHGRTVDQAGHGSLEQKKQYRQLKSWLDSLLSPYGGAIRHCSGTSWSTAALRGRSSPHDDERPRLWERAAVDGTPVRAIVGDDPVEFADSFVQAYVGKRWIDKERERLNKAIDDAEREEQK